METTSPSTLIWQGTHVFFISGTKHKDDTVKIISSHSNEAKRMLTLTLPTLCITYADMAFANAVGGIQGDYPTSTAYGPTFFDPGVTLSGEKEIRKCTWIRGAEEVFIGPKKTVIRWHAWKELVIPRLRIEAHKTVKSVVEVPEVFISVAKPLQIQTMQYANGRHVGGVQLNKFHPDWKPDERQQFNLQVLVVDEKKQQPLCQAQVELERFKTDGGKYEAYREFYTEKDGLVQASGLDCSDKLRLTAKLDGYIPEQVEFRAFPNQTIKHAFFMKKK